MRPLAVLLLSVLSAPAQWNDVAQEYLAKRKATVAAIQTKAEAIKRQQYIRSKILELIGGLPNYSGPLSPKKTGEIQRSGFVIEKVLFQSLPNYWVTANVYRPARPGKFPAVLLPVGHWDEGKAFMQLIASNLALKGFVAMPYDPVGQGERQQDHDSATHKSRIGGSVDQHFMAGAQSILLGQSFARYRIWDAKRAIDYLISRPDVDGSRIGVTGCSGGGTVTAYISALDDRVKASAPSCYITSFEQLYAGSIGDSEQSIPGFLSSGLDQADYLEAFAPRPMLVVSTEKDFFPIAGTKIAVDEARRWYKLFGAEDHIDWVVGKGEHGTPFEDREAIYKWMLRWLGDPNKSPAEEKIAEVSQAELQVTPDGRAPGKQLFEIISAAPLQRGTTPELQQVVRQWVGNTDVKAAPSGCTGVDKIEVRYDYEQPRGLVGQWQASTRALLIGRNLPGIKAAEIIKQANAAPCRVELTATGNAGIAALLAAIIDPRIERVQLLEAPKSLRSMLQQPQAPGIYDALIPGFALRWDVDDLIEAAGRERVTVR